MISFIVSKIKDPSCWIFLFLPYLFLVCLHLYFSRGFVEPWVVGDELIFIGHARYFAGGPHFLLQGNPIQHFGYSLFLLPAFWLFSDPNIIYRAILFINAILISSTYLLLFYFFYSIFGIKEKRNVFFISFIASLYPALFTFSNIAYTNNIFIPFYLFFLILFYFFIKKQTPTFATLFGFAASFLYTIHPIALYMLPFVLLFLLILFVYKKINLNNLIISFLTLVVVYIFTKLILAHLLSVAWVNSYNYSFTENILPNILSWQGIKHFLLITTGQLWYLIHASLGLFFLGFIYLIYAIFQGSKWKIKNIFFDNEKMVLLFCLITSLPIFVASLGVYFVASDFGSLRVDHLIYGRYNEGFIVIYIALGLFSFLYHKFIKLYHIIFFWLLTAIIFFLVDRDAVSLVANKITISGISPLFNTSYFITNNIIFVSCFITLVYLILCHLSKRGHLLWGYILISFIFFCFIVTNYTNFLLPNQLSARRVNVEIVSFLKNNQQIHDLNYDFAFKKLYQGGSLANDIGVRNFYNIQFYLPNLKIEVFDSLRGETSKKDYFVSDSNWAIRNNQKIAPIFLDSLEMQAIWKLNE